MDSTIRLGKVLGIPVGVNYSWLVIFGIVILLLSSRFGETYPHWALVERWGLAVVTTLFFFLSVLAHELSHSIVALSRGIPVKGITLFIFGGVSQLAREAQRPATEFMVAVVGPLVSLLLGAVLSILYLASAGFSSHLSAFLLTLGLVNISLGIFNLLPGFPLDGGRVLRACIWWGTGSYWRATQIAIRAGQALGLLLVAFGLGWALLVEIQGIWTSLIGGFLFLIATSNYRQEQARERLKAWQVSDVARQDCIALPARTPLLNQTGIDQLRRSGFVPVLVDGQVAGIVTAGNLVGLSSAAWHTHTLEDLMTPLNPDLALTSETPVWDAIDWLEDNRLTVAPVWREGVLLGFVNRTDLAAFLKAGLPGKKGKEPGGRRGNGG